MHEEQLLKGVLDIAVLAVLKRGESYGYEIVQYVRDAGLEAVAEASVYGTLRRLETNKLVRSRLVASNQGPARKYFDLTAAGEREFDDMLESWGRVTRAVGALTRMSKERVG